MSDGEALLRWYLVLTAICVLMLPIVAWIGAGLGSARFALTRPIGLAVATGLVWWPALSIGLPFTRVVVGVVLVVIGCCSWAIWWRRDFDGIDVRAMLAFECVWIVAFAGYALIRSYNPDIANTEKPMEIALLSAISGSSDVPAPDPWLAGKSINYYYFGYQSIATLVKLSGVPPAIAFNLALATVFASCAAAAGGMGRAVSRIVGARRWVACVASGVATLALLFAGNLETARRLIRDYDGTVHAGWWDGVGWQASRIIVDRGVHGNPDPRQTINEFPAFSFVLGDLHPHVLTYPLLASVLAIALGIATSANGRGYARLAAVGGLIGLLYASNSWDAPAGLMFVLGGVALASGTDWRSAIRPAMAVVAGAAVAALPFLLTFHAPVGVANPDVPGWLADIPVLGTIVNTFGLVDWRPSSVGELLIVHGVWLVGFLGWLALVIARDRRSRLLLSRHRDALLVAGSVSLALAIVWMPAIVLIGLPLAVSAWVAFAFPRQSHRLVAGLYAVGFLLILIPEFIYLQDVFADRMNTVFKLYFQAWLVLSIASAATVAQLLTSSRGMARIGVLAGTLAVLAVSLPYGPLSSWDWNNGFAVRRGLDGSAYLLTSNPGDAGVIDWVATHARRGDTLVESPGCSYQVFAGAPLSRVSAFTGVPALIGWHGHESQWRRGDLAMIALLDTRAEDTNAILDARQQATRDGISPRFLVLGKQELDENPGCSFSVARDPSVVEQLRNAGWVQVFEHDGARVFVRSSDPLAR